ncbi:GTP-binding protein Di-Ras2 [Grus japonensis]|uniref:GTP-binding protein Di-Ras2 n=1 Tax=Grus japonensis TaxID=30415 RepID=A0ABC9YBP2_GRUJA
MPEQSNDYRVVVFGAGGVGKSSLVLRFVKGTFRARYIPTIEDAYQQIISSDKSICTSQITDTTGSHQFPAMQHLSISKGHAFILVYSITSHQSLEELRPIYEQIRQIKGDGESIPIMLIGNKNYENQNREVENSEEEAMAKKWKCAFMETSAKLNHNVKELFQELLNLEKHRTVSLQIDVKKTSSRKEKLKSKCGDVKLHCHESVMQSHQSDNTSVKPCGGLTLAGGQVPTRAALSLPSFTRQGRKSTTKSLRVEIRTGRDHSLIIITGKTD